MKKRYALIKTRRNIKSHVMPNYLSIFLCFFKIDITSLNVDDLIFYAIRTSFKPPGHLPHIWIILHPKKTINLFSLLNNLKLIPLCSNEVSKEVIRVELSYFIQH